METLEIRRTAARRAPGSKRHAITGVVASGNLEVLLERVLGGADAYAEDNIASFRDAAISLLDRIPAFDLDTMEKEQARLAQRLEKFARCHDTPEIWQAMGIAEADRIADLPDEEFNRVANAQEEATHDAR